MKVLKNTQTNDYQEIVVERKFLWFSWTETYRNYNGLIFRVKKNNDYDILSVGEWLEIYPLFKINPE